jgi:hypothetical protein
MLPQANEKATRDEIFTGVKTDVSFTVPFYSTGWCHLPEDERKVLQRQHDKHYNDRAYRIKMLGYPDPYRDKDRSDTVVHVKNSYVVWDVTKGRERELIRHDCIFQSYPDNLNLLSLDPVSRSEVNSGEKREEEQYDYSNLMEQSIQNYEESELKLTLPEEELNNEFNPDTVIEEHDTQTSSEPLVVENNDGHLENADDSRVLDQLETQTDDVIETQVSSPKVRAPPAPVKIRQSQRPWKPNYIPSMLAQRVSLKFNTSPNYRTSIGKVASNNLPKSYKDVILTTIDQLLAKSPIVVNTDSNQIITLPIMDPINLSVNPEVLVRPPPIKYLPSMNLSSPQTCLEALNNKEYRLYWYFAIKDELDNLQVRKTWKLINKLKLKCVDLHAIKSKYAFRLTVKPDGFLKFRSRLVACGYSQIPGFDYDETFAPTAKYKSLCIIFHLAAVFRWLLKGMDVANAYVEAEIDKLIHMKLPKELFCDSEGNPVIVELLKSLYGLKQAGELWNRLLNKQFCDLGYQRLAHDQCVYIKRDSSKLTVTIIVVYVDDVLFIGNDDVEITRILDYLADQFTKITDEATISKYVGIDIVRDVDNQTIYLSQKLYTDQYVSSNVSDHTPIKLIPMPETVDYQTKGDGSLPPILDKVGKLRYLADRTRPDLLTAVGILGSGATLPSVNHLRGVDHIGRYLKGTSDERIQLGGTDDEIKLFGYCDASHLPHGDSKPRLGYCFFLNKQSGTVHARSFKGKTVSHSSCESEISAIDETIRQAVWMRGFLAELGFPQPEPTIIYTDSLSAKTLIDSFNIGNNSAHLVMRLNYLHEMVENGTILLKYIDTLNQVADILTKLLPLHSHQHFTDILHHGHGGTIPQPKSKVIYKSKKTIKFKASPDIINQRIRPNRLKFNFKPRSSRTVESNGEDPRTPLSKM